MQDLLKDLNEFHKDLNPDFNPRDSHIVAEHPYFYLMMQYRVRAVLYNKIPCFLQQHVEEFPRETTPCPPPHVPVIPKPLDIRYFLYINKTESPNFLVYKYSHKYIYSAHITRYISGTYTRTRTNNNRVSYFKI